MELTTSACRFADLKVIGSADCFDGVIVFPASQTASSQRHMTFSCCDPGGLCENPVTREACEDRRGKRWEN